MSEIRRAGIVGTGAMGASLAALLIGNGIETVLLGRSEESCKRGEGGVDQCFEGMLKADLLNPRQIQGAKKLLKITQDYHAMQDREVLFEAVSERVDVKHTVYHKLDQAAPEARLLASVTSAVSADTLAAGTRYKERLLVAHLWNPPHLIPGVEIVRSRYTTEDTLKVALEWLHYLGREVVVLHKDIEGFIGNRIMHAMYREALYLVEQGVADAEEIDRLIYYSFGQRFSSVGLLEYFDSCGLDLHVDVQNYLFPTLHGAKKPQKIVTEHVAQGNLGMKTGQGIYDWSRKDVGDFIYRKEKPFYQYVNWHFPE